MKELNQYELEQVSGGGLVLGIIGLALAVGGIGYNDGRQDKLR